MFKKIFCDSLALNKPKIVLTMTRTHSPPPPSPFDGGKKNLANRFVTFTIIFNFIFKSFFFFFLFLGNLYQWSLKILWGVTKAPAEKEEEKKIEHLQTCVVIKWNLVLICQEIYLFIYFLFYLFINCSFYFGIIDCNTCRGWIFQKKKKFCTFLIFFTTYHH